MPLLTNYRFPIIFLLTYGLLQWLYFSLPETFVQQWLIHYFTVLPGAFALNSFFPNYDVVAQGTRLVSDVARLNVLKGCEGLETVLMLGAAILACRRSLFQSLVGFVLGCLLIFFVNQLRIIALFLIAAHERQWFEAAHGYIAPIFIIALVGLFFIGWLSWADRHKPMTHKASS